MIRGKLKVMFGTVALVSADNLGSLLLGGFKESCTAYRMCRHCMCTKDEYANQVRLILTYRVFYNSGIVFRKTF